MPINREAWDNSLIRRYHGDVFGYRKLYDGDYIELFPREKQLLNDKEAYDSNRYNEKGIAEGNVKAPYIIANVAKVIAEVPAIFVSRSIGNIKTSVTSTEGQNETTGTADDIIEDPDGNTINDKIIDLQQEMIDQITRIAGLALSTGQMLSSIKPMVVSSACRF
ncbi:hypothetical protein L2D08_19415 [Domibacillus sp. PGB-M46]|uniref:hypothetical protein n=1 Tax=Domibacillus sp. PGB-M46 TaxID=2910255 RepID=UPI001F59EC74|nr:hypothetical protein [Domibacillus sp. PGB-M46]MCI2256512.1 hypothetical protein [Domibacillus sp. PGB-M46]